MELTQFDDCPKNSFIDCSLNCFLARLHQPFGALVLVSISRGFGILDSNSLCGSFNDFGEFNCKSFAYCYSSFGSLGLFQTYSKKKID